MVRIRFPSQTKKRVSNETYTIRKTNNSFTASSWNKSRIWWAIFLLFWIPLVVWPIYGVIMEDYSIIEIIPWFLVWFIFSIVWILWLKNGLKTGRIKKIKKIKKRWWIIKKVKITSFEEYHNSWDEDKESFNWYYLEAKDGCMIYCSDAFYWGEIRWWVPSLEWLENVYKDYWFEYNENHKEDVLNAIDKRIEEQQYILQNAWFFKKINAKILLSAAEAAKQWVEIWYIPPQLKINWHTVSIWDTVNVYIDPEDENNYWMDIDFLLKE